ncbi:MAG: protein kinase [Acidobacteria bacterium]|nr:protein kinase [Acidobacteriota bacterium]
MTPDQWRQAKEIFLGAIELEEERRPAFLEKTCGRDRYLRSQVEPLLLSHGETGAFLEGTAIQEAARMMAADQTNSTVGPSLGPFTIMKHLGAGGMGEVYLAEDTRLHRKVALKTLPRYLTADRERVVRFQQEARAASSLTHPNVAPIFEFGEAEGVCFIAMEYVEGETLEARLKAGPLELSEVIEIGIQVADALQEAHSKGIIHRDMKPGNIMITQRRQVKVLDFGLAKLSPAGRSVPATAPSTHPITNPGLVMGTVAYMSPEQALGHEVDERTDIYSLGVVLHEMATGRRPFIPTGAADKEGRERSDSDQPSPTLDSSLPAELEHIISRCLQMDRDRRYGSAQELVDDLRNEERNLDLGVASAKRFGADHRPPQRYLRRTALIALVLALGGFGYYSLVGRGEAIDSLAILPLVKEGDDPSMEYLSDGITEGLINSTSQLPKLKVIALASVLKYKGQVIDAKVVGHQLGVGAVLTGRILQRGEDLSISLALVDARDNRHLWGQRYDRKLSELLMSQEAIAREIAEKLQLRLSGEDKQRLAKRYTENAEAYRHYLKGRYFWNNIEEERGLEKAIEYYNKAIDMDPNYALAYSGLADSYLFLSLTDTVPPASVMPKAKAAAIKALEIDDTLAEAYTSLGNIKMVWDWDFPGAERDLRRAIELNPNYPNAHRTYGVYLAYVLGQTDEAVAEKKRALELDPLSLITNNHLGTALHYARRYDEAIEQFQNTLELYPEDSGTHNMLAFDYVLTGRYEQAIAEFGKTKSGQVPGWAYALMGKEDEAWKAAAKLEERSRHSYVSPMSVAGIYACLNEKDRAFEWLERAYVERGRLIRIKRAPLYDSLHSDPRFAQLVRRMGLPPD